MPSPRAPRYRTSSDNPPKRKSVLTDYYVNTNAQPNGDHEVHTDQCSFLPAVQNRKYLGSFSNCVPAVAEAKRTYRQSNGCYYCSNACHTG
jgi:hypothetical protein